MSSQRSQEGDITHPEKWLFPDEASSSIIHSDKGKEIERDVQSGDHRDSQSPEEFPETAVYPPMNDDVQETRRIEEASTPNLRRWEIAERQRRKTARESFHNPTGPSLVGDVSRRASLLWTGRKSKHPSIGNHAALQSQDNIDRVPLTEIISPTPSPTRTDSDDTHTGDPFANPLEPLSPFADTHEVNTPTPHSVPQVYSTPLEVDKHASDLTRVASSSQPPRPMPLNLPPPRTPPPIIISPPITQPNTEPGDRNDHKPPESRWWHDWLCGCSEGQDRGGDYQAGRTNPFE
ncbi:hypothetical protein B0H34DRAFT_795894 [Crassisporium funariophilum]|nr:hypothetical protein B0H34DRAFT_795894 [Crassisporium funariophilum]